jgi:hypothetical protein
MTMAAIAIGTPLAQALAVRRTALAAFLVAIAPRAHAEPAAPTVRAAPIGGPSTALDPLWQAELHLGYGLAMSGSGVAMSKRVTPLTVTAIVGFAIDEEPPLFGYGGLVAEMLDRSAIGGVFGVKYAPRGSRLHLAGGGSVLIAPDSLLGATASGGMCRRQRPGLGLCADVQLTAYFAGGDLAPGRPVTQIQLVLGAVFDVL